MKLVNLETNACSLIFGHTDIVVCIDSFMNGRFILSGAKDNQIRLWEQKEGKVNCVGIFRGHNESVTSVSAAPKKSNFFVSAGQDNSLKVWDLKKF